jgi:prevent-host-death family protein
MDINISTARKQLSRLVDQVNAGEEIVITRRGLPVARLIPAEPEKLSRKLGTLAGKGYWIADDFDDPLPDDLLDLFEGRVKEPGTEGP